MLFSDCENIHRDRESNGNNHTTDLILEGLQMIKTWNPEWSPQCFMTDKSAQELEAVGTVHPNCLRFL